MGTHDALNIAQWDGTQWIGMAGGVRPPGFSTSRTLALLDGALLVGIARNGGTNSILSWNGSEWSTFPGVFTGSGAVTLEKILVVGTHLLVGGRFTHVDGIEVNRLAHWNGSQWRAFGSGLNNTVYDLAVAHGNVYVAGLFTQAGLRGSARFAIWTGGLSSPAQPALFITTAGNSIQLNWPIALTNTLESSLQLWAPDWRPFPGLTTTNGSQRVLETTPTEQSRYFRLNSYRPMGL